MPLGHMACPRRLQGPTSQCRYHYTPSSLRALPLSPSHLFSGSLETKGRKPGTGSARSAVREPAPYQLSVQEAVVQPLGFCPDGPPATVPSAAQHTSSFKTLWQHQAPREMQLTPKPPSS